MQASNALHLIAFSAVLLAAAGCSLDEIGAAPMMPAALAAQGEQPAGHEVHRMFEQEKFNAATAEFPPQF